ncbi:hypothetical protein [Streptomyces boncukensis]|uniref:Uncharacterized protein n=1 Tax=Streptomyces boncukensis TaxID=2711219 RepID=A0A6G4X8D6_9ACTN|nr:hypothetical protein [Streptomyces boncukensis]NGO73648.1 hypothetical protein [Streptomyces boncukensis]
MDPVPTRQVTGKAPDRTDETAKRAWKSHRSGWPRPGTAEGDTPSRAAKSRPLQAGSVPVTLTRPGTGPRDTKRGQESAERVQVQVLPRSTSKAAGVEGPLLAVRGLASEAAGKRKVGLKLDYSGFRGHYGGGWASRLHLRRVPACALTTPGERGCAPGQALKTANDPDTSTLSATLRVPAVAREDAAPDPVAAEPPTARSAAGTPSRMTPEKGTVLLAVSADTSGSAGDPTSWAQAPPFGEGLARPRAGAAQRRSSLRCQWRALC